MTTGFGKTCQQLEFFWANIRKLFYNHKTLFEITFLLLYSLEQVALFILILTMRDYAHIFAGIFAILIITTISFEKICMESRYTQMREHMWIQETETQKLNDSYSELHKYNENLIDFINTKSKGET